MSRERKSSRLEVEQRLDAVEEMLSGGMPSGQVCKTLATRFDVDTRQVRRYISDVYARREQERALDAPHRREALLRKIQYFYVRCLSGGKLAAAAKALELELRLSGAFEATEQRQQIVADLGMPPDDPREVLLYARKVLARQLYEAMTSPHLDLSARQRIVADIVFKLGATQSRSEIDDSIRRLEDSVQARRLLAGGPKIVDARTIDRPPTARGWRPTETK